MNREIQILLIVTAGVSSFSTYNSTPVIGTENLFEPIIIPNITNYFQQPQTVNTTGPIEEKDSGVRQPQPTTIGEDYPDEEGRVGGNPQRFSSRYSTKEKERGRTGPSNGSASEIQVSVSGNKNESESGEPRGIEDRKSFSDRSDELDSSEEEEEDVRKYFDANEPEEWEVSPTTNEPSQDSAGPTSFQSSPHPDFENYESTSTSEEEEEEEEEEEDGEKNNSQEVEEKRSVDDYYNSGSKNYHSVQTPLSKIRYRGPHSFQDDFDAEKTRPRLISPIRRPPTGHNWPYSKAELEKENEISESDESSLEEGIRKELKAKPGLELAVEKDEKRFDEKRKYNYIEERGRERQKVESLVAEEEKDHRRHPFQTLKQYQVDEEPRYHPSKKTSSKLHLDEGSSKYPYTTTTPRNIFRDKPKQDAKFDISQELVPTFQGHHFLGPVVFNSNGDQKTAKADSKAHSKNVNKGLLVREKLDQDKLTNERIHKSLFGTGSADYTATTFNHLEESEEMYNAILANIQSVFGLRTQTSKSNGGSGRFRPEESKYLTWSLPVKKDSQVV